MVPWSMLLATTPEPRRSGFTALNRCKPLDVKLYKKFRDLVLNVSLMAKHVHSRVQARTRRLAYRSGYA